MNKTYSIEISDAPDVPTKDYFTHWADSVPAINNASADFQWKPIIYFYCLYIVIMIFGGFVGLQTAEYGAAVFLVLLYMRYGGHLVKLRMSLPVFSILLAIVFSIIPLVSLDMKLLSNTWHDLVKYWALYFVMIVRGLLFRELASSSRRGREFRRRAAG